MKRTIRVSFDRVMQGLLRLCMLTGVTFLVTACYGSPRDLPQEGLDEVEEIEQLLLTTNE